MIILRTAFERRGNNSKGSMTLTWKPRPYSGLDYPICAIFARQRPAKQLGIWEFSKPRGRERSLPHFQGSISEADGAYETRRYFDHWFLQHSPKLTIGGSTFTSKPVSRWKVSTGFEVRNHFLPAASPFSPQESADTTHQHSPPGTDRDPYKSSPVETEIFQ